MSEFNEIEVSSQMLQAGVSVLGAIDQTGASEEIAHRIYAAMEAVRRANEVHPFDKVFL